jgi:hypothetical protein
MDEFEGFRYATMGKRLNRMRQIDQTSRQIGNMTGENRRGERVYSKSNDRANHFALPRAGRVAARLFRRQFPAPCLSHFLSTFIRVDIRSKGQKGSFEYDMAQESMWTISVRPRPSGVDGGTFDGIWAANARMSGDQDLPPSSTQFCVQPTHLRQRLQGSLHSPCALLVSAEGPDSRAATRSRHFLLGKAN